MDFSTKMQFNPDKLKLALYGIFSVKSQNKLSSSFHSKEDVAKAEQKQLGIFVGRTAKFKCRSEKSDRES